MGKWFNWPPFVVVPIDADTGKPLDPNVGMRVKREFYNVGKDGKGKKMIIAHKSGSATAAAEEGKKEGEFLQFTMQSEAVLTLAIVYQELATGKRMPRKAAWRRKPMLVVVAGLRVDKRYGYFT
jgi:hypothetical protein